MNPHIISFGTALPSNRYSQEELRLAYHDIARNQMRPKSLRMVDKIFSTHNGIRSRALACADLRRIAAEGPDELHERFRQTAVTLSTDALRAALDQGAVHIQPAALRALVTCTCTGYLCPGLSSYLAQSLGLREDLQVYDLVGMGCGASLPALNIAQQLVRNAPRGAVAVVSVEVCSAAAYFDDDPELIVSNCIFADGAAAAIVAAPQAARKQRCRGLELIDFESTLWPEYRDRLRFRQVGGRLRNCLSSDVPELAAEMAERTLVRLLDRHGLDPSAIAIWAVHPGGKRVLEQFSERLGLSTDQLKESYRVLASCGNMSSPSVLFVLQSLMAHRDWQEGELGVCSAFGAGLSCHMAIFRTI